MKMQTILFDLDGTVADSIPVILETSRLGCLDLGIPWDENRVKGLIGLPLLDTGELLLGKGRGQEYFEAYHHHFQKTMEAGLRAFAGMPELLAHLHKQGKRLALVTSKKLPATTLSLQLLGMEQTFDLVITADSGCGFKPSPEPALAVLAQLGTPAAQAAFVGDSHFDMLCAKRAGLRAIGVAWGADSRLELREAGADAIATTVAELADLLQ